MNAFSDGLSCAIRSIVSLIFLVMGSDPMSCFVIGDERTVGGQQSCELIAQGRGRITTENHVERTCELVQHSAGIPGNDRGAGVKPRGGETTP